MNLWIRYALQSQEENVFDYLLDRMRQTYEEPCATMADFRRRTTKHKGDVFEEFCVLYIQSLEKYDNVWLLKDVPNDVLEKLNLKRRDMGIDIICEKNGKYTAVQAKYKKPTKNGLYNRLSWKACSTFYALVSRTGPWEKYWIITTAKSINRIGKKTYRDKSTCLKSLENIPRNLWWKMSGLRENGLKLGTLEKSEEQKIRDKRVEVFSRERIGPQQLGSRLRISAEEIRQKRLLAFSEKMK